MEKINVAELLKDCPKGMELDCTMFEDVEFDRIDENYGSYPIICRTKTTNNKYHYFTFTKHGCYSAEKYFKCVIFPKGKTTWEGFHRPFKDGDIVALDAENGVQIFIFKEYIYNHDYVQCYLMLDCGGEIDFEIGDYYVERFATEEEKEKLFDAIKANGYKWNGETKTLAKLIQPNFKVGDNVIFTITSIEEDYYGCGAAKAFWFEDQDYYELVPDKFDITTLVPFESRVLVRDKNTDEWRGHFFSHYDNNSGTPYICIGLEGINEYRQCIPYEENEFLLGKTDDCDEFYKTWE